MTALDAFWRWTFTPAGSRYVYYSGIVALIGACALLGWVLTHPPY